ncbi:NAD(P)-binding protein [Schizopora paradoxa]|uniref:NAD(P)-binding protein n=1 Tax=Schizopora paradoxa TaxID=27342 RepID=A0A0H2S4X1_9AGAM|nr:NAD(P)-binding protein [Schizopora paradoxa]
MKVIVTGASGVLGTAVYDAFKAAGHTVLGLARSRPTAELQSLDLLDVDATTKAFQEFKPDWVVHCAAERRPDVADKDPEGAQKLNGDLPGLLAQLAKSMKFKLVYISTDYVFDGTSPPYSPSSQTNPVNLYGRTKLAGETAALAVDGADVLVLRVPVLYGPAPKNSDTAVNILLDVVQDQSGKQYKMDHYATRYPTNVLDIAAFLVKLAGRDVSVPPIVHFSSAEPYTKYEMCLVFAKVLGVPFAHIIPDAEAPKGEAAVSRPRDCRLDTSATERLLDGDLGCAIFDEWWAERLKRET